MVLNKLEKYIVYKTIIDEMKRSDTYDKGKCVLSGKELFDLLNKRYLLMQEVLSPIKKAFESEMKITNLSFAKGIQDEESIIVEYISDNKSGFLVLSQYDENPEIILNNGYSKYSSLIEKNKRIINKVFKNSFEYKFTDEYKIFNTNNQLIFHGDEDEFVLSDHLNGSNLTLLINYQTFQNEKMFKLNEIRSPYTNVKRFFEESENVEKFLENVKIYEEKIPTHILKKVK